MAQDFLMSNGPELSRETFDLSRSLARDRRVLREAHKIKKQMEEVSRLVAKRASKVNSWEMATLEQRTDFLWKEIWPDFSENLPLPLRQSELCFKSTFRSYLGIELTKEEERRLIIEFRKALQIENPHHDFQDASDRVELA
jgi:hypothetical protein